MSNFSKRKSRSKQIRNLLAIMCFGLVLTTNPQTIPLSQEYYCNMITWALVEASAYADAYDKFARTKGEISIPKMKKDVRSEIIECRNSGSGTGPCGELNRIYQGLPDLERETVDLDPSDLLLNGQTCKVEHVEFKKEVDLDTIDSGLRNPAENAYMRSEYAREARHQRACSRLNEGYRPGSATLSPYEEWANNNPQTYARHSKEAWNDAREPLDDYLDKNCRDDEVSLKVNKFITDCKKAAKSAIVVEQKGSSQPQMMGSNTSGPNGERALDDPQSSAKTFLIRLADWGRGRIQADREPFPLGPEEPYTCPLMGTCAACCSDENVDNKAYLFGGPNQTRIVGQANVKLTCNKNGECGASSGDPHMCTHDGLKYDFHGIGEFILAKTDDFEVQARHVPVGKFAAVNAAVALRIGTDRVAIYGGRPPRFTINGKETEIEVGSEFTLPDGALVRRDDTTIRISKDDYVLEANPGPRIHSVRVQVPPDSRSGGLLGNRNNDRRDDLRILGDRFLASPVGFDDLYNIFGDVWRVKMAESLFDYAKGESTETYTIRSFPFRRTTVNDFSSEARRAAEAICRKAGVAGSANLEDCTYDIALTGDESFAEDAKGVREPVERLEIAGEKTNAHETADGVRIAVPAEGIASFPIEIRLSGPVAPHTLTFAAVGSPSNSRAPNSYSSIRLKNGEQMVSLHAPYRPGEYELRYVTFPGHRTILLSIPFRSIAPTVTILADDSAAVGGNLKLSLEGDISPNAKVTVVPIGSREDLVGPHAFVKGGLRETVTIFRLPRSPGKYEIRFVSATSETVYARKAIEIR